MTTELDLKTAFVTLAKLVYKNEKLLTLTTRGLSDSLSVISSLIARCTRCEKNAATVQHRNLEGHRFCDRCAAEVIINAKQHFTADVEDTVNLLRGTLLRESDWADVEHADAIRNVIEYVKTLKDMSDVPIVH